MWYECVWYENGWYEKTLVRWYEKPAYRCNIIAFLAGFLDNKSTGFFSWSWLLTCIRHLTHGLSAVSISWDQIFTQYCLNSHQRPPPVSNRPDERFNCNFIIGSVGDNYYLNFIIQLCFICILTRPSGSPKYCMTRKNIQRYYTLKCLIRYMYSTRSTSQLIVLVTKSLR